MLSLRFLGGFTAHLNETPIEKFRSNRARALLTYVACEPDRAHSRDLLATLLWGDYDTSTAKTNLRVVLSSLGKLLQADPALEVTRQSVHFRSDLASVDCVAFIRQVGDFLTLDPASQAQRLGELEKAVDLYDGEFLAGFGLDGAPEFEEWCAVQRERLHTLAMQALDLLQEEHMAQSNYALVIRFAQQQIALESWHESAHYRLMQVYARQGKRGAALSQFETLIQTLEDELGIKPSLQTAGLQKQILAAADSAFAVTIGANHDDGSQQLTAQDLPTESTDPNPNRSVPLPIALTTFTGREREIETAKAMLQNPANRLVTLIGLGGVGKTQLALAVARQVEPTLRDGANFVQLAPTEKESTSLLNTVMRAFELQPDSGDAPEEPLLGYLAQRELLLILDNYEHLVGETKLVQQILRHAPGVSILVTSRVRLNLMSEVALTVSGLTMPPPDWQPNTAGHDSGYGAIELFLSIAKRLQPEFALTPNNAADVIRICHLVSGMPLGIELAAAWTRMLSCAEIAAELERNLKLLTSSASDRPERHRDMRQVFEHAWAMLVPQEKLALMRLTCFRGDFDRTAAETITQTSLAMLAELMDKSLLQRTGGGRYLLHELVRQFATSKLEQFISMADRREVAEFSDEDINRLVTLAADHSDYYIEQIAEVGELVDGPQSKDVLPKLRAEDGNIDRALRYAVHSGPINNLEQIMRAAMPFYHINGRILESSQMLEHAIERMQHHLGLPTLDDGELVNVSIGESQKSDYASLSWLLVERTIVCNRTAKFHEAISLAQSVIAIAEPLDLPHHLIEAHIAWGGALDYMSDSSAHIPLEKALEIARTHNQPEPEKVILGMLGLCHYKASNLVEAHGYYEEVLRIARQTKDWRLEGLYLVSRGWLLERMGEFERAKRSHQEGYTICKRMDYSIGTARVLQGLGMVAASQWNLTEAISKHEEAIALANQLNDQQRDAVNRYNLGRTFFLSGDEKNARFHLGKTVELSMDIGDRLDESLALSYLGYIETIWGCEAKAQAYLEQALEIGTGLNNLETMAAAYQGLGWLKLQQENPVAAESHFEDELKLKQRLEKLYAIIDPQTGLVQAALDQGQTDRAEELCDPIFAFLEQEAPHGTTRLAQSYVVCNQVLADLQPEEADKWLHKAAAMLHKIAATFPTAEQQTTFLSNVPINQQILSVADYRA